MDRIPSEEILIDQMTREQVAMEVPVGQVTRHQKKVSPRGTKQDKFQRDLLI